MYIPQISAYKACEKISYLVEENMSQSIQYTDEFGTDDFNFDGGSENESHKNLNEKITGDEDFVF